MGSGHVYDLLSPETSMITIEDVAYGLAFRPKFGGQTVSQVFRRRRFYSLAEHCVRGSHIVDPSCARDFLFHELDKVIWGDFASAQINVAAALGSLGQRTRRAHADKFRVSREMSDEVRRVDLIMEATERRDLLPPTKVLSRAVLWSHLEGIEPLAERIEPWTPEEAAEMFLLRAIDLEDE